MEVYAVCPASASAWVGPTKLKAYGKLGSCALCCQDFGFVRLVRSCLPGDLVVIFLRMALACFFGKHMLESLPLVPASPLLPNHNRRPGSIYGTCAGGLSGCSCWC